MERRRVLAALGTAGAVVVLEPVLAACTSDSGSAEPTASPSGSATELVDQEGEAARLEEDLYGLAADIQARWPATAAVLSPVMAAHAAHVPALIYKPLVPPTATDSSGTRLPATASAALRKLAAAELAASKKHAVGAESLDGPRARLLASIAAYAAAQEVALTRASTTVGIGR